MRVLDSRRRHIVRSLTVVVVLLLLAAINPSAQVSPTPADTAAKALRDGRFDEVDRLLQTATDPRSIAIKARAAIARGRYDEAQKMLAGPAASAPTSDAALELALLDEQMGRRDVARTNLNRLADGLNSPRPTTALGWMRFGYASQALGRLALKGSDRKGMFDDANKAFENAAKLAPKDANVPTALGLLWTEANDPAEAAKYFQEALKLDEMNPVALVGFARILVDQNPPDAHTAIAQALKVSPNYEAAHLLAAEMSLDDRKRPDAQASVNKALGINPNSLEALSLDAAIAWLEGRSADFDSKVQKVLSIQPKYGEVYRVAGDHAARNYRFEEAVDLTKKAVALDPDNNRAYADLGMHLLRTGDEPGARAALERSFSRDATDIVTFNLLDLLDRLDKYTVAREGNIIMKFEPKEAAIMREQALPFAREALDTLAKRWNVEIKGPVLIEMFPKHDDFAVRNLGLPGMIGALGACFGRVVTLDSPHARQPGEYNWQPTLWHELAHVVSLQISNNRVPRWLTEGISVWEERRGRPEWGREMEVPFAQAMEAGKIFKLSVLNEGFSDPELISLAYHQASLVAEHLAKTYGEASLGKLLQAYGRGLETDAAVKEAFNVTLDDIQKSFDAELEQHYRPLITALKAPEVKSTPTLEELKKLATENPGSFLVQMGLGRALAKAGDTDAAIAALEKASALVPWATGDDNPNKEIATIALAKKDNARAITALQAVLKVDHADVAAARALIPLVANAPAAQKEDAYQRLVNVDPFEGTAHAELGRLAMQRRDGATAVKAFRTALASEPPDRAAAMVDLGDAYLLARQPAEARTQALAALEIAPSYERAQDLLLRVVDGGER
jgi:tetratricopeptide (TPR) repeat protein